VRQAVAEFQGQFMNQADLSQFFQTYVPQARTGDDVVYAYVGTNQSNYGIEALLDIEYIMGVGLGVKTEFWEYANDDFCSDLKRWTSDLLSTQDIPVVHSISYGYQGEPSDLGCTAAQVTDIEQSFSKLAARGISIIFASGDSGSGESWDYYLYPSWPSTSEWVTAVGSTMFTDSTMTAEQATTQFGSGSGFAWDIKRPSFQQRAVGQYLQNASLPFSFLWNDNGRGTADVSALGENFQVIVEGQTYNVGGTSCSTPTFAAMISLINDQLALAGKKPLGYLNPFLYSIPQAFYDVTIGSDMIDRSGNDVEFGFNCAPGWDPPSGLGTVNFPVLLKAALGN